MTREQIDAIRARARSIEANKPRNDVWLFVRKDVPTLLAEVERLTAERDAIAKTAVQEWKDASGYDDLLAAYSSAGHERDLAFSRGVAAMREAVVKSVTCHFPTINAGGNCGLCTFCDAALDKHIRALPDPEDTE